MKNTQIEDRLLTRQEAAEFLGVTVSTLAVWACTGRYDLPYVKIGGVIRYRLSDLVAFLERHLVNSGNCNA